MPAKQMPVDERLAWAGREWLLRRHPHRDRSSLRAWDTADLLLLDALNEPALRAMPVVLLGDRHGALATVLGDRVAMTILDSANGQVALESNFGANHSPNPLVRAVTDGQAFAAAAPTKWPESAVVAMKLPRSNALLELRLRWLSRHVSADTVLVAGVMAKRLSRGAVKLLERFGGPTTVSLARRKARLVTSGFCSGAAPAPALVHTEVDGLQLRAWPAVFGATGLDAGAAALLPHIRPRPGAGIVDLGCGSGVLGLFAAKTAKASSVVFVDDSDLAVRSARASWEANAAVLDGREATFVHAGDLSSVAANSASLVVCNPPFHQEHTLTRQTANAMFGDARRVLSRGGQLLVVGNRHLGYDEGLRKHFDKVRVVAADRRFTVLAATDH